MTELLDALDAWSGLTDDIIRRWQLQHIRYCPGDDCGVNTLPNDKHECLFCDTRTRKPRVSLEPFKKQGRPSVRKKSAHGKATPV